MFEDTRNIPNAGAKPLEVWFEPWGIVHHLPPGEVFRVVGRSPQEGQLEVVKSDFGIAIYGWPGSTLQVFNGESLVDDFSIVFPDLPPGMSARSFVDFWFGGPGGPKGSGADAARGSK